MGVFIWYSLEMAKRGAESQKAYMDSLDRRDSAFENRNKATIDAIASLNNAICLQLKGMEHNSAEHDKFVRENLTKLHSRSTRKAA